jgi:hypothetical protein
MDDETRPGHVRLSWVTRQLRYTSAGTRQQIIWQFTIKTLSIYAN